MVSGVDKLYGFLTEGGYDCIICPHVFSALMITELKHMYPEYKVKSCFIATDYTFAPITGELKTDAFFVPDIKLYEIYADFTDGGMEKIHVVSGIPVRRDFYNCIDKPSAKKSFGLPPDCRHIIMMFGSMGCGPIPKLTGEISETMPQNCYLTVVCATNDTLRKKLSAMFQNNKRVHIEGYVKNISSLMDSADLYVTKPGGLSISEAKVKRLPLVLVNAVAGCEQGNLEFFVEKGAAVTAENERDIARLCKNLVADERSLDEMSKAFGDIKDSSQEIFEIMSEIS